MSGLRREMVCSVGLESTLEKVQRDRLLDFAEYSLLRESADAKLYQLRGTIRKRQGLGPTSAFEGEGELEDLLETSQRMAHLLQSSCLALRRLKLERHEHQLASDALEHQLAYMQACLRRALEGF
ncbi:hypothetical protein [Pseudomonas sp. UFMG81]|jgi:hypothetical protein|uniref:hypothetical protein n=1 Tax=Pseudomonas sp. UFMG81 TaxID=2745936 RepID=UPI00188FAAFC|nr:hypothetical protein [Pseudomonas sp. UFMG81]